jgi:hypothetical protein
MAEKTRAEMQAETTAVVALAMTRTTPLPEKIVTVTVPNCADDYLRQRYLSESETSIAGEEIRNG